ncbi:hypothetical protein B0T20DRAFT_261342 [Sordaria brevicollis]|uniref:JmjC domain-containing protein n=1 Tax=Sordaria brevicollis TaxID=83679 RepID=A0AAE0PA31_SORBR|nr:hypothetical protein B0T20DRAFT_261342 [Sordaria brevicollis]
MDNQDLRRGHVDSIRNELGQICHDLRRYLDEGTTLLRKVKPPDVKAARDLLEHIIVRIHSVDSKLASSDIHPDPLADGPHTPVSNVDVSSIVHHQQQFVPADSVEPNQESQQLPLNQEPVQQPHQLQGQQEVQLQPEKSVQHQQQEPPQGQGEAQPRSNLEYQLQPEPRSQQYGHQYDHQVQSEAQQDAQMQPQLPAHQQIHLHHQKQVQAQGQREVVVQVQQSLQQHDQLSNHLQSQQRDHLQDHLRNHLPGQLQDQLQPQQAVPRQEQPYDHQVVEPQTQGENEQHTQQEAQQDQPHQRNQLPYQQQEHRHPETACDPAPEEVSKAVPEAVSEAMPNAGAGIGLTQQSSQSEPPTQNEIHATVPAPQATLPAAITDSTIGQSSTSHGTGHDYIEAQPRESVQLPLPKLLPRPKDSAPLFDCTYQDVHVLNEELFELCSLDPEVQDRGYFKLQVRDLPPLQVGKMGRPDQNHATSFVYKKDNFGLVKVDTGKKPRIKWPKFPLPVTEKQNWTLKEQKQLWNSTAAHPPNGARPYIIGNPLFDDVELSPGEKLRRRGPAVLEGINTQYIYFNLTGKTITVMHREDAHVRSENLLRAGENKFWCFIKPSSAAKLEERMRHNFPEMRSCSQAIRHLSRHIPPAKLDEWGVEYTLDYCVPGQAVVTEPGTYHQVLNLGPNYALAINVEYESSPDDPPNYTFCDEDCPDQFAISAEDFRINPDAMTVDRKALPAKTKPMAMMAQPKTSGAVSPARQFPKDGISSSTAPVTHQEREEPQPVIGPPQPNPGYAENSRSQQQESGVPSSVVCTVPTNVHESQGSDVSELNPPVLNSGLVGRDLSQHVSEPQQIITEPQAPPEVQDAVPEVQQVTTEPEGPPEVQRAAPGQEFAVLPIQPFSQTGILVQQQEQSGIMRAEPVILSSPQPQVLGPFVDHYQEHPRVQATVPVLHQSTASAMATTAPTPFFKIPDIRFVGPPVLQPFDGAIQAFDREFKTQTFRAQQPSYEILQPPPELNQSSSPTQVFGSYAQQPSSDSQLIVNGVAASGAGYKRPAETAMQSTVKRPKSDNNANSFGRLASLLRTAKSPPVEQVWTKAAFLRLAGLVRDWREYSRSVSIPGGGFDVLDHIDDAEQVSQELHVFLRRFFKMKLSECTETSAQTNGFKDAFSHPVSYHVDFDELARKLNWDLAGRNQLNDFVREGKCWRAICGRYKGLLCLLPSGDRFVELAMFEDQLAHFHTQVNTDAVQKMCAMGQILERSIWEYLELPEFAWESVDTSELSLDEISPLLSQFKLIKANHYDCQKYNWGIQPSPLGWTDPWPSDPMSVLKTDKKGCSLCNSKRRMTTVKSTCKCLVKRLPQIPRISEDGSKGAGVRAVGSFKANEFLGELVGELRPPRTQGAPFNYSNSCPDVPNGRSQANNHDADRHSYEWTMEVCRPDLHDQVVAEIYPQQMGNWVRKVRHDGVNPSAAFKVMKISGKWRVMLMALKDIRDGEEITAKYGRGYRKEQPYEVVEGLH